MLEVKTAIHNGNRYLVPRDECGCGEGETRVLHPAVGEGGGQHQDVVGAPHVGTAQCLSYHQHRLCLRELEGGLLHKLLLRPDMAPA